MYYIKMDGEDIYNPERQSLMIQDAKLTRELNKVDSFEFTVFQTHSNYEDFEELTKIIKVYRGTDLIFEGRILTIEIGWEKEKKITCESYLGMLNDHIVRPLPETTFSSVASLFEKLLDFQEDITFGTSDMTGETTVTITDYPTVLDAIQKNCVDVFGGYLQIRIDGTTKYLDWKKTISTTSTQKIAFGKNLLDLSIKKNGDDIFTCIIPLGAEDEDSGDKLTIGAYPDDYIQDSTLVAKYGKIYRIVEFPELDDATALRTKATEYLTAYNKLFTTVELSALDLSQIDADYESFSLGTKVEVSSSQHGLTGVFVVNKLETDLLNPSGCKLTLGDLVESLTMKPISRINIETKNNAVRINKPLGMYTDEGGTTSVREDFKVQITSGKTDSNGVQTEAPNFLIGTGDTPLLELTDVFDHDDNKRKRVLKNSASNIIISKDRVWLKNAVCDGMSAKGCNLYGNFNAEIFINKGLILQPNNRQIERKGNVQAQDVRMAYDWCCWAKANNIPFNTLMLCELSNEPSVEYCMFYSDVDLSGKSASDWGTFSCDCYVYFYNSYGSHLYTIRSKSFTYTYITEEQNTWIFGWDWFGTHTVTHTARANQGALYGSKSWGGINTDIDGSKNIGSGGETDVTSLPPIQSVDPSSYNLKSSISDYGQIRDDTYSSGGVTCTGFTTSGGQSVYFQVFYGSSYSVFLPTIPDSNTANLGSHEVYKVGNALYVNN